MDTSVKRVLEVSQKLCEGIDTPVALGIYLRIEYGEFEQLLTKSVDPNDYTCAQKFRLDHQACSFLKKYPNLEVSVDREHAASVKFTEAEKLCSQSNLRIRNMRPSDKIQSLSAASLLMAMSRKISRVLGDFDYEEFIDSCGWGPGATSANRGVQVSHFHKFSVYPETTKSCLPLALAVIQSTPSWAMAVCDADAPVSVLPSALRIVQGSRLTFVPKTALIDRAIAVEPHMNIYIQKGIGLMMRKRLRRVGIDLNDQSHNQNMARIGSKFNTYCTIDLSSASDTICRELVSQLLPEDWLRVTALSRSESMTHGEQQLYLEKWSSMGNGYTFELETLIFWAACSVVYDFLSIGTDKTLLVYGDDIICHRDAFSLITDVLVYLGFEVNSKKSFGDGPFRESCGKDYFNGTPVRAVYLREDLDTRGALYRTANLLRRQAHNWAAQLGCDSVFLPAYKALVKHIRQPLKGPDGYGDGFLISNFDEVRPKVVRAKYGIEGYHVRSELSKPSLRPFRGRGLYVTALYLAGTNQYTRGNYQPRGLEGIRVGNILCRDWYDLGPWV